MKVATSPGHRGHSSKKTRGPEDDAPATIAEAVARTQQDDVQEVPWDPSSVRSAADRLQALVEKRGA
jgi:hypothetical protein